MKGLFITRLLRMSGACVAGVTIIATMLAPGPAHAGDAQALAPPVSSEHGSVFNWTDVPRVQRVPIQHASFDQGGYQLYDTAGETIVVPFTNHNLYVMKFQRTSESGMYFVNTGEYPLLYVPDGGSLENATVSGARWYPFPHHYEPSAPVFIGMAPTWDAYVAMGWYPDMCYWGGYWCHAPYWTGGVYVATPGLEFIIGGHPWYGWWGYWGYYHGHPGWRHTAFFRDGAYRSGAHPSLARPPFRGAGRGIAGGFHGAGVGSGSHFGGSSAGGHVFRGVSGSSHSFGGGDSRSFGGGGGHSFSGSDSRSFGGGHSH